MTSPTFEQMRDLIMHDEQFQAACQHYAQANGSSGAIAAAAVRVIAAADPAKDGARDG